MFRERRILICVVLAALGCDGVDSRSLPGRRAPWGDSTNGAEAAPVRAVTSEAIARTNLDSDIADLERRSVSYPTLAVSERLVELLLARIRFYGTFEDFDAVLHVSSAAREAWPNAVGTVLLRAKVLSALHEFDQALALLDSLEIEQGLGTGSRLSKVEQQTLSVVSSIKLARTEDLEQISEELLKLVGQNPTFEHLTGLAGVEAALGRFDNADHLYERAASGYRDVSPYPLAFVAFQRGVMWSEQAGYPELGRHFYERALSYLPRYVLANVHLAELDAAAGDTDHAIQRLLLVASETPDPEPLAVLASVTPDAAAAAGYAERAARAYKELRQRWPRAFEHHVVF